MYEKKVEDTLPKMHCLIYKIWPINFTAFNQISKGFELRKIYFSENPNLDLLIEDIK